MPEIAKSYQFGDQTQAPMIDGQEFPWYVSLNPAPMVQNLPEAMGAMHVLWLPVIVDAPMPTPPEGHPDGLEVTTISTPLGPICDIVSSEES